MTTDIVDSLVAEDSKMKWVEFTMNLPDVNQFLIDIGLQLPSFIVACSLILKLVVATALGAMIGWERQNQAKAAGLRTHMIIALGAAIFTIVVAIDPRSGPVDIAQVVKGIAAGVGFLGAGAILKESSNVRHIQGLTTAAGIWLCAALGLAAGAGQIWMAVLGGLLTWGVLRLDRHEDREEEKKNQQIEGEESAEKDT